MSLLSSRVRRTSELLRLGAEDRVSNYEKRFSSMKDLYERFLSRFIVSNFRFEGACETTVDFFGSDRVRFAGIDGTMYSNPLYDLVIFFGGAYAVTGRVIFRRDDERIVEYDSNFLESGVGISSVVPIYINKVPEVDQTFFDFEEPCEISISKPLLSPCSRLLFS